MVHQDEVVGTVPLEEVEAYTLQGFALLAASIGLVCHALLHNPLRVLLQSSQKYMATMSRYILVFPAWDMCSFASNTDLNTLGMTMRV